MTQLTEKEKKEKRLLPLGTEGLTVMRRISQEHSAEKYNEVLIDVVSASTFIQVYDKLNEKNQSRLLEMCPGAAMEVIWKVLDKSGSIKFKSA